MFLVAVVSLAGCLTAGCAEKEKNTPVSMTSEREMAAVVLPTAQDGSTKIAPVLPTTSANVASVNWIDIKDCTYDLRASFFAGLKQLEGKVDNQVTALTAKRAAMTSDVNTKDWDFAMKEVGDARSFLKSVGAEMGKASADTWTQQKDAVGQAWLRTQTAYDKVLSSTTR